MKRSLLFLCLLSASLPAQNKVTITAASVLDPAATDTSTVTLLNPLPVIAAVNGPAMGAGMQLAVA